MSGPLQGIRVIDVSAVVSGPLATMLLADQGADVIKVETPEVGDILRLNPNSRGNMSSFYLNCNRSKRAMVLDLSKEEAREILKGLIKDADVFVQNWRPGAAERLGLGWEDLHAMNPNLIYCAISGYGPSGPYSNRRVYDPIIQGLTGHVAVQNNPDVPIPDLVRNIVADKSSAYTAAQAITSALFARERGAGGQRIDVPMMDASLAFFWPDGMLKHTFVGEGAQKGAALYEIYRLWETRDGRVIWFANNDSEYYGLFRALKKPEWCHDPRFCDTPSRIENLEELGAQIMQAVAEFSTQELLDRMIAEDVPAGAVLDLEALLEDPQLQHNEAIVEQDHPMAGRIRMARPAARFHQTPQHISRPAPGPGEHTEEILREAGLSAEEIDGLRTRGAIS